MLKRALLAATFSIASSGCGKSEELDGAKTNDTAAAEQPLPVLPVKLGKGSIVFNSGWQFSVTPATPPAREEVSVQVVQTEDVEDEQVSEALAIIRGVRVRLIEKLGHEAGKEGHFRTNKGVYYGVACAIGDTKEEAIDRAIDRACAHVRDNLPKELLAMDYFSVKSETQDVDLGSITCVRATAIVMERETR